MKVKLLNKERAKDLFKDWGEFAKVCYDTKTDTPEKIGKHCKKSGHNSGSRSNYIVFRVDEVPRFLIDQSVLLLRFSLLQLPCVLQARH